MPLIPTLRRQSSVSSRPGWSRKLVPGQAPKLQRNPVSKKQKKSIFIIFISNIVIISYR